MVALSMPKFQLRTRIPLRERLRSAGAPDLFDPTLVDLSDIAGAPGDLVAGEVIHQAVISVDEHGTEAAAATAMSMMATGAPSTPVPIVIDRSFFFMVHETISGAALFLGQVIDPTA
jgi:serpin B